MPEGKLLGPVILTCPHKVEILELPTGSSVVELLSKAAAVFGAGQIIDRAGDFVTSKHPKLDGGYYTFWPDGANDPESLHVRRKGAGPRVQGSAGYVRRNVVGTYRYDELAAIAGYSSFLKPKCLILGDPEIIRIYPTEVGTVFIDRSKLGDLGTKGNPVPVEGLGWWSAIKDIVAPPAIVQQPHGVEMGLESCTAVKTH